MGRPITYSAEVAKPILERLAEGESLLSICRDEGMPPASTVRQWVYDDRDGFAAQYAHARDLGLDQQAESIIDIADTEIDPIRARVMIDARKWHLSKMAPKRYGDKLTAEVTGADGGPLVIEKIVREVIDAA